MNTSGFYVRLLRLRIGPYLAYHALGGELAFKRAEVKQISRDALAAALGGRYLDQTVAIFDPVYRFELYALLPNGSLVIEHWRKRGTRLDPAEVEYAELIEPDELGLYRIETDWQLTDKTGEVTYTA